MVSKEEITPEVFWDVFKTATVTDLPEVELDEDALRPVNAKKMCVPPPSGTRLRSSCSMLARCIHIPSTVESSLAAVCL